MRRVRPVLVKTMPITSEPKMNHTEGSMKSVKATRGSRIRNRAWITPIRMLVTPMGMTSKTHQVAARKNRARAALTFVGQGKGLALRVDRPASGVGISMTPVKKESPMKHAQQVTLVHFRQAGFDLHRMHRLLADLLSQLGAWFGFHLPVGGVGGSQSSTVLPSCSTLPNTSGRVT